jgi:hypothetical protein
MPPFVRVLWPNHYTITQPEQFASMAAEVVRLMAAASTALASMRGRRQI